MLGHMNVKYEMYRNAIVWVLVGDVSCLEH